VFFYISISEGLSLSQKKTKAQGKLSLANQNFKRHLEASYGVEIDEPGSVSDTHFPTGKLEEMMHDLRDAFIASTNYKRKLQILTLSTLTTVQTANFFGTTVHMVKKSRCLKKEYGILPEIPAMSKGKVISNEAKLIIKEFFESDEVSRMCPGQKDCLKVRDCEGQSITVQKRLILGNMREIFALYKSERRNPQVGFSTFAKLRPTYCVLAGAGGTHSVCVCTYHQNPKLQLAALGEKDLSYKDLIDYSVCDSEREECMMMKCQDCPREEGVLGFLNLLASVQGASDEIAYKQWMTVDRCTLIDVVEPCTEFLESLSKKIASLVRHHFLAQKQAQYFKELKENLELETEAVVVGDFAENYSFIVQDAAQGFHWENSQCTVHPFVVYFKDHSSQKLCHNSFCFLSDSTNHNTVMVHTFISKLLSHIKVTIPNLRKIHYFSDGCAGQYKNRYNFINLCHHEEDFGLSCEWNFFATSHGKNACDGIGGTVKRATARASLHRTISRQIVTPVDMFKFCEDKLSEKIKHFFVSKLELEDCEHKLKHRFTNCRTIQGTQKLHRFVPQNKDEILVYPFSSGKGEKRNINLRPGDEEQEFIEIKNVKVGQYISCKYETKVWIGIVEECCEEFNDVIVNFLEPSVSSGAKSFHFPRTKDVCAVPGESIVSVMALPTLRGGTRLEYTFPQEQVSECVRRATIIH